MQLYHEKYSMNHLHRDLIIYNANVRYMIKMRTSRIAHNFLWFKK